MKNMKIGIFTINDNENYGNRLQNYALQEILKKKGIKVETIINQKNRYGIRYYMVKLKRIIIRILNLKKDRRKIRFLEFNKNINFTKYAIDENHIPYNMKKRYDYCVTGSDQVWNPNFGRLTDIDLLKFAKPEQRIAFSASFGVSDIPDNFKEKTKTELKKFKAISVREDRGKEIVEELTERKDVQVLVDPTMLLTSEEWDKVANKPEQLKTDKYILNYILG